MRWDNLRTGLKGLSMESLIQINTFLISVVLGRGIEEGLAALTLDVNLIPPCLGLSTHTF